LNRSNHAECDEEGPTDEEGGEEEGGEVNWRIDPNYREPTGEKAAGKEGGLVKEIRGWLWYAGGIVLTALAAYWIWDGDKIDRFFNAPAPTWLVILVAVILLQELGKKKVSK
jgi:hypothetical protein